MWGWASGVEGRLCGWSTKGGFILTLVHSRREREKKKEGDPFKCGAAALIYWVKVGEKDEVAEVR